ncbi:MAG: AAA family ATPase [Candidatus Marsarchaeota archaeon]|nr:AAA family ATPase [Candidatus Marsarchaeota archaeon]
MISNTTLRLDRISLHNFRCFEECTVELHPKLTVLVAENGCGKTAILDAIGIAVGLFVDTVSGLQQNNGFDSGDIRLVHGEHGEIIHALPTEFLAEGIVIGHQMSWLRSVRDNGQRFRPNGKDNEYLRQVAEMLRDQVAGNEESEKQRILPLVAQYGTERFRKDGKRQVRGTRDRDMIASGRMSGYNECLSSRASFNDTIEWYGKTMDEIADPRFKNHSAISLLAAVEKAMRIVLKPTGWCKLDWDSDHVIVEHINGDRLRLSALSDGVRNMVALVMDIARRCATLNPHLGDKAAEKTPGLLLIDEIDMHLHPSWQQQVVELLREAFKTMQIVLTTHSPHVLSTVDMESIRIVQVEKGQGLLVTPKFQTRGVESADVLAMIMGVNPIPQVAEAKWLSDYRALVQVGRYDTEDGHRLWDCLVRHFGKDHPVIHDAEVLLRLQEFKKAHNLPQSEDA